MKIYLLMCLFLLQSCLAPMTAPELKHPHDENIPDQPTEKIVIVDYYTPSNDLIIPPTTVQTPPVLVQEEIIHNEPVYPDQALSPILEETLIEPVKEILPPVVPVIETINETPPTQVMEHNNIEVVEIPTPIVVAPTEDPIQTLQENNIEIVQTEVNDNQEESLPELITPLEMLPVASEPEQELVVEEIITINEPEQQFVPTIPLVSSTLIPEDTKQIVSLFVFYASLFNKKIDYTNLIIEIEENPKNFYIAYCSKVNNNKNPKIKMNSQVWKQLSLSYREMLLFHEMGHCLLDRPHEGNNFYNPSSIMNASLFSDIYYKDNYDFFINELFGGELIVTPLEVSFGNMYEHIH